MVAMVLGYFSVSTHKREVRGPWRRGVSCALSGQHAFLEFSVLFSVTVFHCTHYSLNSCFIRLVGGGSSKGVAKAGINCLPALPTTLPEELKQIEVRSKPQEPKEHTTAPAVRHNRLWEHSC